MNKNKIYKIESEIDGIEFVLNTSTPSAKRAKKMTIKTNNKKIVLNGHHLNALRNIFKREQLITKN
jgi:hypothetical protein